MMVAVGGDAPQLPRWKAIVADVVGHPAGVRLDDATAVQLLGPGGVDASSRPPASAVLGGSAESVLAAARSVGAATPLLIVPTAADAPTIAYALLPAVDDGRRVLPAQPWRWSAAVREYVARFSRGDLGDLRLMQFDRTRRTDHAVLAAGETDEHFLQDVDLLRLLGGDYNRITALQIGVEAAGARQTTVTLAADGAAEAVWSLTSGERSAWRLTLTGTRGVATLVGDDGDSATLTVNGVPVELPGDDPLRACVERFLASANSDESRAPDPLAPSWTDMVRAADLLQGLHRSLRRRRTIDLHFDSGSERSQFKSQMAAIGCGVLMWALLGTCCGLLLGGLLDPRDGTERRAAAADTILWHSDYGGDGTDLAAETLARLVRQTATDGAETIILIERHGANAADSVDSARLQSLTAALKAEAGGTLIPQLEVRPLAGRWFYWGMMTVWCVTFGPLMVFLLLQGLLAVTRSAANGSSGDFTRS